MNRHIEYSIMPISDETPDYSDYSLKDLYDVQRRIDRVRYAHRYALIARQIERREAEIAALPKPIKTPLLEWLFASGDKPRNATTILAWWKERQIFWCSFVSLLFLSDCATIWGGFFFTTRRNSAELFQALAMLPLLFLYALVWWGFLIIPANIVLYCAFLLDVVLSKLLRFASWQLTSGLFFVLLALTIGVAVLPLVGLYLMFFVK